MALGGLLKNRQQGILLFELIILFFLPVLPDNVLLMTDNYFVRAFLLLLILAVGVEGPFVILMTFVLVLCIFVLRNNIKMRSIRNPSQLEAKASPLSFETEGGELSSIEFPEMMEGVPRPPAFETPVETEYDWTPGPEAGSNLFAPVAPSIDEKVVLPSQEPDGNGGHEMIEMNRELLVG
jgi:hypothetical protein